MIRRYNYTGRKRLPRSAVRITIVGDKFRASWDLARQKLPASATVYVEAFSSGSPEVLRFGYGTVGDPDPEVSDRVLAGLAPEATLFNFKVVDETKHMGRLLGVAKNIRPTGDGDDGAGQQSLLPVSPVDLRHQVWRLDFNNSRPWLEVNSQIPGVMDSIKTDRRLFALVYPAVIRQVLSRALLLDGVYDPDADPDGWHSQWLRWGIHWHFDGAHPDHGNPDQCREQWEAWIEEVVDSFCKKHRARDKFIYNEAEEEDR